jgi:hypothetical protein
MYETQYPDKLIFTGTKTTIDAQILNLLLAYAPYQEDTAETQAPLLSTDVMDTLSELATRELNPLSASSAALCVDLNDNRTVFLSRTGNPDETIVWIPKEAAAKDEVEMLLGDLEWKRTLEKNPTNHLKFLECLIKLSSLADSVSIPSKPFDETEN